MPGRTFTSADYRFSVNGTEKSPEIGSGHNTTFFRELDARTGRWWSVDPVWHPWESPYATFANNPVFFDDPHGDDPGDPPGGGSGGEGGSGGSEGSSGGSSVDPAPSSSGKGGKGGAWKAIGNGLAMAGKWLLSSAVNNSMRGRNSVSYRGPEETAIKVANGQTNFEGEYGGFDYNSVFDEIGGVDGWDTADKEDSEDPWEDFIHWIKNLFKKKKADGTGFFGSRKKGLPKGRRNSNSNVRNFRWNLFGSTFSFSRQRIRTFNSSFRGSARITIRGGSNAASGGLQANIPTADLIVTVFKNDGKILVPIANDNFPANRLTNNLSFTLKGLEGDEVFAVSVTRSDGTPISAFALRITIRGIRSRRISSKERKVAKKQVEDYYSGFGRD